MSSWLSISPSSPFSLENLPFGIISSPGNSTKRPAVAVGAFALDLSALVSGNAFSALPDIVQQLGVLHESSLNSFAELGRGRHRQVREYIRELLLENTSFPSQLKDNAELKKKAILPLSEVTNHLPLRIGDYTDFYAGLNHAYNAGVLFRGPENALQPNYKHLPVAYHGRASSIVVSGNAIRRPCGQILGDPASKTPIFSSCKKLDFELELAAFVCKGNDLGSPVPVEEADEHIFGYVLMNDWSARDIQAWEYVPLGPFNGKNFGTTISPWVVLADAMEPFRVQGLEPGHSETLLPYLRHGRQKPALDIDLKVELAIGGRRHVLSHSNASNLLYSWEQMLAHHTVTGCNMNAGDLIGSGTISGTSKESLGSLLEMTMNGKQPLQLEGGATRTFIEDGEEVIFSGVAGREGRYVGFGECKGTILAAAKVP